MTHTDSDRVSWIEPDQAIEGFFSLWIGHFSSSQHVKRYIIKIDCTTGT